MTRTGNVGGRIVDNEGQPAVGVPLQLLRTTYNQVGQRIFQNAGSARTNDRGEYRFYWVTPGRYFDPDVMRRSENFGKAIQVTESSRLGTDLKIIPAGQ